MRNFAMLAAPMALISFAVPAQASEWTDWTRMNPDSYKVTMAEMTNRCLASVALTGEGSRAECEEVATMLQANQCQFAPVPDGVRYDWMNGLKAGRPHVYTKKVKALGAPRMAYVCKTSTGRVFDWYVGENGISCGNLGLREFVPGPRLTITPTPAPPSVVITTTVAPRTPEGSSVSAPFFYGWPGVNYGGGDFNINAGSRSRSTSTSTSGDNGCCKPQPGH